jgi:hypothetical protein
VAVNSVSDSHNRGFNGLKQYDLRWNDVNIISSLMKSFPTNWVTRWWRRTQRRLDRGHQNGAESTAHPGSSGHCPSQFAESAWVFPKSTAIAQLGHRPIAEHAQRCASPKRDNREINSKKFMFFITRWLLSLQTTGNIIVFKLQNEFVFICTFLHWGNGQLLSYTVEYTWYRFT